MEKFNKLIKGIIIATILILIISIVLASIIDHDYQQPTKMEEEYLVDDVNEIIINSKEAEIEIVKSSDEKLHIYGSKDNTYQVEKRNGKLTMNDTNRRNKHCFLFCFNKKVNYQIEIPESYQHKLTITTSVADINMTNVSVSNLKLTSDVGDIHLKHINASYIAIKNDVGDIELENVKAEVMVENNVGDIEVENLLVTGNSRLQTDTGDIEIELSSQSDCEVKANTDIGKVKQKGKNLFGTGRYTVDLKTSVGDIEYSMYK